MCVSGFSSEKIRYGRSALSFYFTKIFYIDIAGFITFPPPPIFSAYLTIFSLKFTIKCLGSEVKLVSALEIRNNSFHRIPMTPV